MGQIVKRKKKGRPSKADLARRASEPATVPEIDVRRSLRRRNVRYNIDYDDYLDEDEEFVEVEEEEEEEEEVRRREKKLRVLMKLNQVSERSESARGGHARSDGSEEEDEDESERKPLKKRRIDGVADEDEDDDEEDEHGDEDEEERGHRVDSKGGDSIPGTPIELPSRIPLPEKKTLELILDKLQKKDTYGVYAEPVDPEELPDYHDVIEHPMDFATVRKKLGNGSYTTLEQFESDVFLICSNAMQYNSAETVYHKQARSIQELAKKKFYKLRIAFERAEKEVKSEQKPRCNSFVKKQIKKPVCRTSQELIGSDFSSGATLATPGDLHNSSTPTQAGGSEKPSSDDRLVENNSFLTDMNQEKTDELSSGKGYLPKLGKKSLVLDENRRATYNISSQPAVGSESVFTTFEGEIKQLVAVGLHAEYSYARSLARFAATIGPVAWKIASQRIEQALPDGCKFGRGWVGEYEPLPTPVLMVENCTPKEPDLARRSKTSAGLRKVDETFRTSLSPREHAASRPTPDRKSSPFAPSGPSLEGKPSLFAPSGTRPPSTTVNATHQLCAPLGTRPPSTTVNATHQQCNPTPRNFTEPQNKDIKQVDLISPSSARQNNNNNSNLVAERKLTNSSEVTTSRGSESLLRNTNALQPAPFKQHQQHSNGIVSGGLPNGRVTVTGSSNRMTSPSPDAVPNQMARTATYFPRGQEQGLTDPVQLMRMLSEKSQMHQKFSNQSPVDHTPPETPPVLSVRREDSTNAASVAARAWMSIGAAGFKHPAENSNAHKDQISADSLYNPTRELHPQFSRVREEFPPGGMQFRPEMSGFPHPKIMPQQYRMSNEVQQLQNRPMIFPQFVAADLSRFQVQPPWRSLSPRSQPRQKQDTFPPDLNIGFQSPGSPARQSSGVMVDSQQPDLALQL